MPDGELLPAFLNGEVAVLTMVSLLDRHLAHIGVLELFALTGSFKLSAGDW